MRQIAIGDEVYIGAPGRGYGHGAYITVEKINRRSIKGTERQGSYKPGTKWSITAPCEIALVGQDEKGLRTMSWGTLDNNGTVI